MAITCLFAALSSATAGEENRDHRGLRITFVGDVCFDGNPGHAAAHGIDPFAAVAAVLKDTDLAVANLECSVPTAGEMGTNHYSFKAPTECIPALKRYFSAVTAGQQSLGRLGPGGVRQRTGSPGAGEAALFRRRPHRRAGPAAPGARVARPADRTAGLLRLPAAAIRGRPQDAGHGVAHRKRVLADIRAARTRYRADTVIPFLHWGTEHVPMPDEYQVKLASKMIDAGADAVIGAHPHIPQTVDWYRGKPIVYSLGNFVFNYFPKDPPAYYGWIVRLTFGKDGNIEMKTDVVKLEPSGLPRLATQHDKI